MPHGIVSRDPAKPTAALCWRISANSFCIFQLSLPYQLCFVACVTAESTLGIPGLTWKIAFFQIMKSALLFLHLFHITSFFCQLVQGDLRPTNWQLADLSMSPIPFSPWNTSLSQCRFMSRFGATIILLYR